LKIVITQGTTQEASCNVLAVSASISRLKGMEDHALIEEERFRKYFPDEEFGLQF
jgi:hypothetical protein